MEFRSALKLWLGRLCVWPSFLLLLVTVYCFWRQPDELAAFTVMPIWLWGAGGLLLVILGFYFVRASYSRIVGGLWLVTLLLGADESRVLLHFGNMAPLPGRAAPDEGKPALRVLTLNCATGVYGNPTDDIAVWQPDIVLLQDILPGQAQAVAQGIYGGTGEFRAYRSNAILTRWKFKREIITPNQPDQHATISLPSGVDIEIVNVHLATAATDLRLWRKSAWVDHRNNRVGRQEELAFTRNVLATTTAFPKVPVIFGGDFNAPAPDIVFRQLTPDFTDAFAAAGTGWGDTFQRRLPILRIDRIFTTPDFTPIRSRVVATSHSDHRMVVADFLLNAAFTP